VIDATSFETDILRLGELDKYRGYIEVGALFFDPSGGTLYTELRGTLYEWDLQKNKHGPEWWIGEEWDVRLDKNTFIAPFVVH